MQRIKDQINHALANQEELIRMFASEPDAKLVERLTIIHLQYLICEKDNDVLTGEFLEIMRRIIIEARLYKWDNNTPDQLGEMQEALAEMELVQQKQKERIRQLKELNTKPVNTTNNQTASPTEETSNKNTDSIQLGLF